MDKVVLITGSSRGIGAAAARAFAEKGYKVAVNYCSDEKRAKALCAELSALGCESLCVRADVSDFAAVTAMVAQVEAALGEIGVLVNNAGVAWQGLTQDMTESEYRRVMDVNFGGVFNCTKAVLPSMIKKHRGSIVNVSSVLGVQGASCETVYSASKAAIIGFTSALAKEVGPSGIRVNAVAPGVIETEMNACHDEQTMKDLASDCALGRNGTAAEVASAIVFLAEDGASFITGQTLRTDGSWCV